MNRVTYKPKKHARMSQEAAEIIGREHASMGAVTAEEFYRVKAEPEDAPAHHLYDWDRDRVFHRAHIDQTRYFLRSYVRLEIVIETNEQTEMPGAVALSISEHEGQREYTPTPLVLSDTIKSQAWVEEAYREYRCWLDRYRSIKHLICAQYPKLGLLFEADEEGS